MVAPTLVLSPPLPSTLAIAGRAGHAFTPHAMMQGYVCHSRGVELAAAGPSRVHARVRSKRVHDVHLRAEHGRLSIGCTCPARSFGLDYCKHAWAALLEVDRQDALSDLRRTRGPLVVELAPPTPESTTSARSEAPKESESTKQVSERRARAKASKTGAQESAKAKTEPARPEKPQQGEKAKSSAPKSKPQKPVRSAKRR